MTVALVTRGYICGPSPGLALHSWGVLCFDVRPFLEEDIGFGFLDPGRVKQCPVFNKPGPVIFDQKQFELLNKPGVNLTGNKEPILGASRPSLMGKEDPLLYNKQAVQFTGAKVVNIIDGKRVLLSEPEEPTLTSSGTKAPELFDKCEPCDDC